MTEIKELYWDVSERVCQKMGLSEEVKRYLLNEVDIKSLGEEASKKLEEVNESVENLKRCAQEIESINDKEKREKLKYFFGKGIKAVFGEDDENFKKYMEGLFDYENKIIEELLEIENEIDKISVSDEKNSVVMEALDRLLKREDLTQPQLENLLKCKKAYETEYEKKRRELEKNPELKRKLEALLKKKEELERAEKLLTFPMAEFMKAIGNVYMANFYALSEIKGGMGTPKGKDTILYSRIRAHNADKLRMGFGAEIGHKIAEYFVEKDELCISVSEFYDILGAYCSGSPYPEEVIKENAVLGELSLNGVDITSEDEVKKILGKKFEENRERYKRWIRDAQDYVARHGRPGHQEGAALFLRLAKVFGDNLPKIAGKALRDPRIDFSNPNSFYESVIKESQGDAK